MKSSILINGKPVQVKRVPEAEQEGYTCLTVGYDSSEYHLLSGVLRDLDRGEIAYCLVPSIFGHEVWRQSRGMKAYNRKTREVVTH